MKKFEGLRKTILTTRGGLDSMRRPFVSSAILCSLALFFAPFFSSCDNVSGGSPAAFVPPVVVPTTAAPAAPAASGSQRAVVTFCGTIGVGDALPQEISANVSALAAFTSGDSTDSAVLQGVSKSAQPDLNVNGTAYYYYVSATPQDSVGNAPVEYGKDKQDKFTSGSFEVPLKEGKWIIECGIKNSADKPVLKASSGLVNLTAADSVVSRNFNAAPVSDAGNGSVLLYVKKGTADVATATARWTAGGTEKSEPLVDATTLDPPGPSENLALNLPSIERGAYEMTISFYNSTGVMVFQTAQNISVFSGMKTDKWVSNGDMDGETGTGLIDSDGFEITAEAVNVFKSSYLYVSASKPSGGRDPSDANEGTAMAPFEHLQKAFDTIAAIGSSSVDYTIYVCGTVAGDATISGAVDDAARSLTIEGVNQPEAGQSPSDVLAGGDEFSNAAVLGVKTKVPVKIKNVKITKSSGSSLSVGIDVNNANANVTLLAGAEISGNKGGVETIEGVNYSGGGVRITNGTLCLKGGVIKNNEATQGGAVYVNSGTGINANLKISGASKIIGGSDAKNDVYLAKKTDDTYPAIQIAGALSSGATADAEKIAITAADWYRKKVVVKAADDSSLTDISAYKNYFKPTGSGINFSFEGTDKKIAKIIAPYFVASNGHDTNGTTGTQSDPYRTLGWACSRLSGGDEEVIKIDGNLLADEEDNIQKIPINFGTDRCAALTIEGATAASAIDGGNLGSALTIDTAVPVTIKNLKITKGTGTTISGNPSGGGLYVKSGKVTLSQGAIITGNHATNGGGVYVDDGATFVMESNSEISGNHTEPSSNGTGAGGGLYLDEAKFFMYGSAIIGRPLATGKTAEDLDQGSASNYGNQGGAICTSGSASIYFGYASCNSSGEPQEPTELTGGVIGNYTNTEGGGIWGTGKIYMASGKISCNKGLKGGGVYLPDSGEMNLAGGSVEQNAAQKGGGVYIDSAVGGVLNGNGTLAASAGEIKGNVATGEGGAVYNKMANFKMSGKAWIPCDGEKKNDVYLNGATITIADDISLPSGKSGANATITPSSWTRGLEVLTASGSGAANLVKNNVARFRTIDADFDVEQKGTAASGVINAPLCVASGTHYSPDSEGKQWSGAPNSASSARGTRADPFASMSQAAAKLTDSTVDYKILVNGAVGGTNAYFELPSSAAAKSVTIKGATADNTKHKINGNFQQDGPVIKWEKAVPLTIQNLAVTGGKGDLGGGIYMAGGTNVTLESGALIGDSANPSSAASGTSACGNYAKSGGGVYVAGTLTIKSGSYINHNWAEENTTNPDGGGGIFVSATGSVVMEDGAKIIKNGANQDGGAIYIVDGGQVSMTGGQITGNVAGASGGAVCNNGTFSMKGSAYIPCSEEKKNDVYLADGKTIKIAGSITAPDSSDLTKKNALVTPAQWKRGVTAVLDQSSTGLVGSNYTKFATTDSGDDCFSIGLDSTTSPTKGIITAPIIVAASPVVSSPQGTAKKPYPTIAAAISGAVDANNKEIKIKGTLTGAQTISSPAYDISLKGKDSSAKINAGSGSALTVNASGKTVTISSLTITGGSAASGGGINLAAGTVNLDDGAKVTANKTSNSGAGVYVASGATLNIKTGSEISSNSASSGSIKGGGVYNDGTVLMTGGTISSNTATTGGAIYNTNSLTLDGTVSIPAGTGAGQNDIAVYYDSTAAAMKMVSAGSSLSATASSIAITPTAWVRGKQVLTGTASKYGCFKMSDGDWWIIQTSKSSTHAGKIDAPIYVSATGNGTKGSNASNGYTSLANAVSKCWLGPDDTDSTNGRIIYISGTVNGPQSISSSVTATSHATKLTLQGTGTSPTFNGGGTPTSNKRALYVETAVPVVIKSLTVTGGYTSANGAGIYVYAGNVDLASGAVVSGNTSTGNGGGVYVASGATLTVSGGSILSNGAKNGGGVYVDYASDSSYGTLNMTGGKIGDSGTPNTATTSGGAVYNKAKFNISGGAVVYAGTEKSNDVYLPSGKYVTPSSFTGSATITPNAWSRGTQVLDGSSAATYVGKFSVSDSDWTVISNSSVGKIDTTDQTIYVSDVKYSDADGYYVGDDTTGRGTKKRPYHRIQTAAKQTWKSQAYTIEVNGTLDDTTNADVNEIPNDDAVCATSITLSGKNSAKLDHKGMSGRPLTIKKAVPITIQNITITGGAGVTYGGGICIYDIAQASLTLGQGAVVTGNQSSYGGGIYISGTGTGAAKLAALTLSSTAKICGNTASFGGTDYDGGGVYAKYVNVYMSGSALIGDTDATYTTGASSTSKSNLAKNGGGIYAVSTYIYMGYANILSDGTGLGDGYGVCHNYASANGGGIYLDASSALYMGSGKISKNGAATNGGGIYNLGNVFLHTNALVGDASSSTATNTANSNKAGKSDTKTAKGGGIYTEATGTNGVYLGYKDSSHEQALNTGKGVIGNSVVTNTSTDGSCGGCGIYCNGGIVKMASGNLSYNGPNTSSSYSLHGGGIYVYGGTFTMSGGTIADNYAYNGGGVYASSGTTFTMTGGTIGNSSLSDSPATFDKASNLSVNGGGVYVAGTANLNGGIIAGNGAQGNSYGGGGVYVAGTATVKNAIRYNIIAKYGNGIYCASDNCSIEGATLTKNRIYVASGKTLQLKSVSCPNTVNSDIQLAATSSCVNVTASLSGTGRVATIQPSSYATTTFVLAGASSDILSASAGRFAVLPNSGEQWSVSSTGYLTKGILASGMAAFLGTLPAGSAASPNDLKINVSSDDDIKAVGTAIANGGKYVNVTFQSPITTLPQSAFSGCTYLAGITISEGTTILTS